MRILITEDDGAVAAFVQQGLREASYAVDWASNGLDALHLATTESYDAIVLDLMLPGMDGLTLLRNLRSRKNATPIICLTARDSVNDRVEGLNAGADDYLPKEIKEEIKGDKEIKGDILLFRKKSKGTF